MASKKPAANDAAELVVLPATAPKETDLMAVAAAACDGVVAVTIDSPMMYELAGIELVELQAMFKKLEGDRFALTRPLDAVKKGIMDLYRKPLEMIESKAKAIKAGMLVFDKEEKHKAAEKQALLDQIAAEQRAELARKAEEQAKLAAEEHERAKALMDSGNTEGVAEALNKAEEAHNRSLALAQTTAIVTAATAATDVPMVEGITTADVWKARVTDLPALLRFIADNPKYHDWIEVKMTDLNELAKAQRTELRVPGVEAFEEARIAAGRTARKAA